MSLSAIFSLTRICYDSCVFILTGEMGEYQSKAPKVVSDVILGASAIASVSLLV